MLVETLMTAPVLSVLPEATLSEAIQKLLDHKISGLPVIDANGDLVGVFSEGDLLRRIELGTEGVPSAWSRLFRPGGLAKAFALTHGRKVDEVMSRNCLTVERKTELADAVSLMQYHSIRRLPVIDEGKVVGILTRSDIVRALAMALQPATFDVDVSDAEIMARILTELQKQGWAPTAAIDVVVDQGHVALNRTIVDDRQRMAARVVAENVVGVRSVTDRLTSANPMALMAF
jgi:CBS domain-containing protein